MHGNEPRAEAAIAKPPNSSDSVGPPSKGSGEASEPSSKSLEAKEDFLAALSRLRNDHRSSHWKARLEHLEVSSLSTCRVFAQLAPTRMNKQAWWHLVYLTYSLQQDPAIYTT